MPAHLKQGWFAPLERTAEDTIFLNLAFTPNTFPLFPAAEKCLFNTLSWNRHTHIPPGWRNRAQHPKTYVILHQFWSRHANISLYFIHSANHRVPLADMPPLHFQSNGLRKEQRSQKHHNREGHKGKHCRKRHQFGTVQRVSSKTGGENAGYRRYRAAGRD